MSEAPVRPGLTVAQLLPRLRRQLRRAGNGAALEARMLVGHVLGVPADEVALIEERAVTSEEATTIESLAARREAGEPVNRIVGMQEFWGLGFALGPDTLAPRQDTETVVAVALAGIRERGWGGEAITILDLGVGSGAILLSLLSELPEALGVGVDRSLGAASVARANARRLGLAGRCCIVVGDWGSSLYGKIPIIVSNPPYIRRDDIAGLDVEVREHDPILALDGGKDGFNCHRAVMDAAGRLLAPDGLTVIEVGFDQAETLAEMAERRGWRADIHPDLRGVGRAVALVRR